MLARPVLEELVHGERRVVAPHELARGVAAGAELRDPRAVLVPDVGRRPALADVRRHLGVGGLSAVAAGAHEPAAEVDVAHDLAEVEVGVRVALLARLEEDLVRQVRVRVAEDAVVAQDQLDLAVVDLQREERREMRSRREPPVLRRHEEQLLRVAGQAPESRLRLLAQDRARLLVHFREELLKIRGPGLLDDVPRRGRGRRGGRARPPSRPRAAAEDATSARSRDRRRGRAPSDPSGEKQGREDGEGRSAAREPAQMRESVQRRLQEDGDREVEGRVPPLQAPQAPSRRARSR